MLTFVSANKYDATTLTNLAIESEATWGFDPVFMEIFNRQYSVTDIFIENNLVFKMLDGERVVGFLGIIKEDFISELEYFYIEASYIGKGYGKQMWRFMCEICKRENIGTIQFVTSPEAVPFYESCGAVQIDTVESLVIPGRMIPKFVYQLNQSK